MIQTKWWWFRIRGQYLLCAIIFTSFFKRKQCIDTIKFYLFATKKTSAILHPFLFVSSLSSYPTPCSYSPFPLPYTLYLEAIQSSKLSFSNIHPSFLQKLASLSASLFVVYTCLPRYRLTYHFDTIANSKWSILPRVSLPSTHAGWTQQFAPPSNKRGGMHLGRKAHFYEENENRDLAIVVLLKYICIRGIRGVRLLFELASHCLSVSP